LVIDFAVLGDFPGLGLSVEFPRQLVILCGVSFQGGETCGYGQFFGP